VLVVGPAKSAAVIVLLAGIVGCGSAVATTAAPPIVVCGTTLSTSAAGPVMPDIANGREIAAVTLPSLGGLVFVKVSDDCQSGADVSLTPSDAFEIVKSARASDGRYAAVVLKPLRLVPTLLTASRGGRVVGTLEIALRNM
jgi:hypothetical protein